VNRFRNRITGDDCSMTGEVSSFGLVGIRYDDDPRTFFISPSRLEPVSDVLGEQLERELRRTMELQSDAARAARAGRASHGARSGLHHPATIAIARKSA
jgi:hypothetical protein